MAAPGQGNGLRQRPGAPKPQQPQRRRVRRWNPQARRWDWVWQ
ncbi:hypothetical protein [Tsukamurella sp. NPDC003166]